MARISTYPIISTPTVDDLLIGTDVNDLNITKNFTIGEIGQLIGQDYVPYVGATGNVNLGSFNITASSFIVPGGLASQFVKADGSLDGTAYTPQARTLTINGTTYNLSANRSWDLNTLDSLTTIGTGGAATYIGKVLNIPVYQAQGAYITQLSGEATAVGPGNATVTLDNTAVISKILTGLNVTGGTVLATDTILQAFGKVQNQINGLAGGVEYQGTWNAATNNPFLQSSVGVQGHYYVVNVAGNTNLNGITDWQLGDWAIYNGSAWEKVDNTDAVVSVNGYTGAVVLTSSDVGAVPTTRTITINGVGYNLSADRSWTVGDVRTDQSYINPSWIASLAWSKITGTPTTLAGYGITDGALNTRTLTINGTTYDLTANRTWNVGTVTSVGTSGPLTGGTITGSGTIGITQAGASSDGYLSSADWNAFNSKQEVISVTAPITFAAGVIGITQSGASSNGYLSSTDWTTFNSKVSGSGTANTIPMWGTASSLINSPLSYAADAFNFQYNSATGGTVNFTNIGLIPYTYSIQMNNFGSPRSTVHSYTDGVVIQSIGGIQVSRMFANGNMILGTGTVETGHKLTISGDLFINTIINAITDTDRFIVSDGGIIKYRTGAEVLSDIGAQGSLTLTTTGTSGASTLIGNTLNIPQYTDQFVGTVTSVGLSMPSAFSVSNSPITSSGTIAVTGAGTASQYVRGDGTLADFPTTGGGGSSVSYYLNGSVSQGTIGGVAYRELSKVPILGAGTDISINANGYIASFITDAGDPNLLEIPGGNWNFETYFSASSGGGSPTFYVELYKYDGTTFTLIASNSATPELISFGTNIQPYFSALAVPQTTLLATDRLAVRYYVVHSGRTITLHTENGHLCQIITTFTTGLTALNGLTDQVQYFQTGTSGTDFNISSLVDIHTFNLPTASATNRGALSSADWSIFNGKQNAITLTTTGTSGVSTLVGSTLNIPNYSTDLSGYVTLGTDQTITGLKTILRGGDVLNFKIGTDTLYGLKVAYNQNELVPSGEATWSFVNTFNRNGTGYETTPISFFRGVLVTGQRLLSASINTNLLDYYSNNPSGRYPIYAYNTGVQQFASSIIVGETTGVVDAITGAIADLPAGVVANFNGRVIGGNAVNSNEFVTLSQVSGYVPTSRTITINGTTQDLSANRTFNVGTVTSVTASSPLASSGGATPNITISQSSGSTNGFLSSTDWTTFNSKQNTITLTTTGTSGAATLVGATLNIPNYGSALSGYLPLTGGTLTGPLTIGTSVNSVIWNDGNGTYIENTGNTSSSRKIRLQAHNGSFSYTQLFIDGAGGFVEATNQMRAPIFYDSNNTSYYLDPASSGTSLNINGGISTTAASGSILLRHPVTEANAWLFMENAPNWGLFWFNNGAQSGQTIGSYTTIGAELFGMNNAVAGFNPNSAWTGTDASTRATWMLSNYSGYIWSNSTIFAAGDMRAPIFYDSNNTGFYIDAASTSVLNALTVGGSSVVTNNGGTWGISITGNSATATNLSNNWTNWGSVGGFSSVVGSLAWKNYGNNHVIFDASQSTSPSGASVNNTNAQVAWTGTYPTLMGWNGSTTYGVRVDSARVADSAGSSSSVPWSGVTSKPSYLMYYQGFTLDANTMDTNSTGFTYGVNAPYTGPIARFSANGGYDLWLNAPYGGDGYGLAFRTRNGDSGTFNSWRYPAVYNVNVNGGGALYATIYYDQNNTGYYTDPSGTSALFDLTIVGASNKYLYINPGNGYEAMVRYNGGSGSGWYAGKRTSAGINSTADFHFFSEAVSNDVFGISTGGTAIASGDMRAPIFYDSNNTGFYFDGASTTNINVLSGNGKEVMQTSDSYLRINQSSTFANGTWFGGTLIRGDGFYAGSNGGTTSSRVAIQSGSYNGTNVIDINGSNGIITVSGDMRAPIFYDSNNTAYYVNPASNTYIYGPFQVNGDHGGSQIGVRLLAENNGAGTGQVNLRMWCSEPGVTWAWAGFGYNVTNDNGSPGGFGRLNTNFGQAYMRFSTDGELYFYNTNTGGTRTQSLYLGTSGAALFGSTIQNGSVWINNGGNSGAYDENIRLFNAPNGVSVIAFSATGLSGMPTTSILGYSDRMEFRYGNGAQYRIYNGYTESMGSSRAPIFYDSDNTAFYLDPATGSQLNGIVTQNYLTASSCNIAVTGVGGQITFSSSVSTFGSWFRATQHIVIENTIGGYNIYVLDANGVGVVKNAGAQSWSAHSDARIKTVHSTLQNNLSKLDSINPIYYSFNNFADDKNRIGLIAQEVQEHFPELVATDPKTDNLTLDYTGLIPVLLGAIKELKTEIETLKTQL